MWELLGLDLDSQAKGEQSNLTDDRSKLNNWDLGDRVRSLVTGQNREAVLNRAAELQEKDINNLFRSNRTNITETLGGTSVNLDNLNIDKNETQGEYEERLRGLGARGAANVRNIGIEGYDQSKVTDNTSLAGINALGTQTQTALKNTEKQELQDEVIRQEGNQTSIRQEGRTERANIRSDDHRRQDALFKYNASEKRLDRRHERELTDSKQDLQMQMATMQEGLQEKRMDYDRETRRMDKRDRMIAQLLSGLGALGSAF